MNRTGSERVEVEKTYKIFVNGKFPRTESGRYYTHARGEKVVNVCRSSRKDFRDAMVAARDAFPAWQAASAFLRGQILYRIAEMLEGRKEQFVAELGYEGFTSSSAADEVELCIDRLIYYAGWSDKYQQVFSSVNPVNSAHFNFSVLEPTGVVAILSPENPGLVGLISNIAPAIVGGNTCVALASETQPLSAISFAEVLHSSDVPAGVVNILTGFKAELMEHFASHMDANAIVYCDGDLDYRKALEEKAAENIKRVVPRLEIEWTNQETQDPYLIADTQETKTTWHPVGA